MKNGLIDNRYEILRVLGKGGMGEVFQVKDLSDQAIIALKMLSIAVSQSEAVMRFKREFSMLTHLNHPNLCKAFDFGTTSERRYYFTMEFVDGVDMYTATNKLECEEVFGLVVQVCRALSYIHSRGYIHYDIKPGNILIVDGVAKLMDFGLAGERITSSGALIKGTPQYMAPEVVKGIGVDARADLYSLGITLFEIVSGKLPFKGDSSVTLLREHLEVIPEFPHEIEKDIPEGFKEIILKLMSKDPFDRYQNANEIIRAINKISKRENRIETVETKASYVLSGKFVGRDDHMQKLKEALQGEESKFVLIEGEMGSGKTRLLREFRYHAQLQGALFLSNDCQQKARDVYQPLKDLTNQLVLYAEGLDVDLVKKHGAVLAKLMPQLSAREYMKDIPAPVALDANAERLRLFHALVSFLREIKQKGRSLLISIENIQWIDEASLAWLLYLVENFRSTGVSFFMTFRIEEMSEEHHLNALFKKTKDKPFLLSLHLDNLGVADVQALIGSMLGDGSKVKEFSSQVFDRTRGNPFFIEQVLHHLIEAGKISWEEGIFRLGRINLREIVVTTNLSGILQSRLAHLSKDSLHVLKLASVFGKKFSFQVMTDWGGFDESVLHRQLIEMSKKGFLVEELEDHVVHYDFAQAGVREMIYNKISKKKKGELHASLAHFLEERYAGQEEEIVDDLSYHFSKAGDLQKAFRYSLKAGERAQNIFVTQKALNYYMQSMEIYQKDNSVATTLQLIDLYNKRGSMWETLGEYEKAFVDFKQMMEEAEAIGNKEKKASGIENLAVVSWRQGDFDTAIRYHTEAKEIREEIGDRAGVASSFGYIGAMLWTKGINDKALEHYEKAIAICEEGGLRNQLGAYIHNVALVYRYQGDIEKTGDYLQRSLRIFREMNSPRQIARNLHSISNVYYYPKLQYDRAFENYQEALKKFQDVGDRQGIAACLRDMGEVHTVKSRFDDALVSADKAIKIFREIGEKRGIVTSLQVLGNIYFQKEHFGKALGYFKKALSIAEEIGEKNCTIITLDVIGNLYRELGDVPRARELHLRSYDLIQKYDLRYMENRILAGLGADYLALEDIKAAEEHLARSLALTKQTQEKDMEIQLSGTFSELAYAKGEHQEVEGYLNKFLAGAEEIGSRHMIAHAYYLKAKYLENEKPVMRKMTLRRAQKIAEDLNLLDALSKILSLWSELYFSEGKFRETLESCEKCIQIFKTMVSQIEEVQLRAEYLKDGRRQKVFQMIEELKKK